MKPQELTEFFQEQLCIFDLKATDKVMTDVMNMRHAREYKANGTDGSDREAIVHVYEMGDVPGPAAELHVAVEPQMWGAISRAASGGNSFKCWRQGCSGGD